MATNAGEVKNSSCFDQFERVEVSTPCKALEIFLAITCIAVAILGALTLVAHVYPQSFLAPLINVFTAVDALIMMGAGVVGGIALGLGHVFMSCQRKESETLEETPRIGAPEGANPAVRPAFTPDPQHETPFSPYVPPTQQPQSRNDNLPFSPYVSPQQPQPRNDAPPQQPQYVPPAQPRNDGISTGAGGSSGKRKNVSFDD